MKVIFLDFDGVLNCEIDFTIEVEEDISKRCIGLLNNIIKETKAEVVVSSVWRNGKTIEELQTLLEKYGFEGKVIGTTPHLGHGSLRGNEIRQWIETNIPYKEQDNFKYVILDDDSDMLLWQKDNFLCTDGYCGITPKIVYQAIRILNK